MRRKKYILQRAHQAISYDTPFEQVALIWKCSLFLGFNYKFHYIVGFNCIVLKIFLVFVVYNYVTGQVVPGQQEVQFEFWFPWGCQNVNVFCRIDGLFCTQT